MAKKIPTTVKTIQVFVLMLYAASSSYLIFLVYESAAIYTDFAGFIRSRFIYILASVLASVFALFLSIIFNKKE